MFCPYCGSELERVGGELACRRGGMELSPHMEERLCAAFVHGTDEPSRSPVRYRVGGRWYCPGCGVPAVTGEHSVACSRCGKHLTPFLVELVELHSHGGVVDAEAGAPRGD